MSIFIFNFMSVQASQEDNSMQRTVESLSENERVLIAVINDVLKEDLATSFESRQKVVDIKDLDFPSDRTFVYNPREMYKLADFSRTTMLFTAMMGSQAPQEVKDAGVNIAKIFRRLIDLPNEEAKNNFIKESADTYAQSIAITQSMGTLGIFNDISANSKGFDKK